MFEPFHVVDVVHSEFVEAFFVIVIGMDAVSVCVFRVLWQIFRINDVFPRNHVHENICAVCFKYLLELEKVLRCLVEAALHLS